MKALATALVALCGAAVAPSTAAAQTPGVPPIPIPEGPLASQPEFQGAATAPQPIEGIRQPPRHPFMAPNGRSNIHNDAFQTDVYEVAGPSGTGRRSRPSSPAPAPRSRSTPPAGS